jgi:3-hydroxybutyryl-CoA dehydrogenase
MEIKKIGVLGAGAMGNGIAQVCAQAGFEVLMRDIADEFVQRGLKTIEGFLSKGVERGKISEDDKKKTMDRITGTTNVADLKDVDFIIEAVLEDLELKKQVFQEMDDLTRPEVVLATNTSSMSITEIGAATKRPARVVGMHFFNPVPMMKLVEVIMGMDTSDETVAVTRELSEKLGKMPVIVKKDVPGFIVNRLMIVQVMEAIRVYEEGIASIEDIDTSVKGGLNHPMGPFELMDLTGLDINYHVNEYFHRELNQELKHVTPLTLKNMVRAGKLGRKTKEGWYKYDKK